MAAPYHKQTTTLPLRTLLLIGVGTRIFVDTSNQIFNPFLTTFAAGLDVSVMVLGLLITLRSLAGLTAPLLGEVADRLGHLVMTRLGLVAIIVGLLIFGASSNIWLAAAAMIPMGVGLGIVTPSLQAYLSAHLSYDARARGLGIMEYSWALAGIFGLSLMGQLIALTNWRIAFFVLAALMVLALLWTFWLPSAKKSELIPRTTTPRDFFDLGSTASSAWGSIIAVGLIFYGIMNIIIIHSEWLTNDYGLSPAHLGIVALILGIADLAGSVLVSAIGDRVGARNLLLLGTILCLVSYLLLPLLNIGLLTAILALVLIRLFMQISFVSNIPILSEQVPMQRGKVMALAVASGQVGLAVAGFTGPWLYKNLGLVGLGSISGLVTLLTLFIIMNYIREVPYQAPDPANP